MFCAECQAAVAIGTAVIHPLLVARRPLQHLHAAHRAADHGEQLLDAQMIDQAGLRVDHVANGDDGKVEPVGLAGRGVARGRPRRPHATAEDIGADHEEAAGVDRFARPDQRLPPAGLLGDRMNICDMLVAGQSVADQDRVGALGIERAVGLVGDGERAQLLRAIEPHGRARGELHERARRPPRLHDFGLERDHAACGIRTGHGDGLIPMHRPASSYCLAAPPDLSRTRRTTRRDARGSRR